MTETEMFWQYADEAMRCARLSTNAGEKRALTDIAFSWSQAALHSEEREGKLAGPSSRRH